MDGQIGTLGVSEIEEICHSNSEEMDVSQQVVDLRKTLREALRKMLRKKGWA